jgi:hypothetical protein
MMKARFLVATGWYVWASLMALSGDAAFALCWDGRHPDVSTEFKASDSVVTGFVVSSRNESSPDDPQGYQDTIYTIRVIDVFKGKVGQLLELISENTSGRFPMNIGKKYLLFVSTSRVRDSLQPSGLETYVDSCGNSGTLDEKKAELEAVRRMSGKQ